MDSTSSIYLNIWLKDTPIFCYYPVAVSEQILRHMNIRVYNISTVVCVVMYVGEGETVFFSIITSGRFSLQSENPLCHFHIHEQIILSCFSRLIEEFMGLCSGFPVSTGFFSPLISLSIFFRTIAI